MDMVLCDELLQEIFQRLPPSSSPSVSLVSKRWLSLLRSSTTSLSIRIPPSSSANTATNPSFSCILSHYPFLSHLTVLSRDDSMSVTDGCQSADALLLAVAAADCSPRLFHLRFHPNSPVSPDALLSASASFTRLASLHLAALRPLSFRWLAALPSLKTLSLVQTPRHRSCAADRDQEQLSDEEGDGELDGGDLPLETLSLSGLRAADRGLSWLWRRCGALRWLQLRACEGTGDGPASPDFPACLGGLVGLELRTCRTIADRVLLRAADHCRALASLLLYDGGSRDALHHFIARRGAALRTIDLRLPLDLHNDHLFAIGDGPGLAALRLQSCCLVTGDGLRSLARAPAGAALEELALVNCDVVEREPGLLTFLGQSMPRLRRLDLSHNETLADKEVGSMLASCRNLVDIRLRGCRRLTGATMLALLKCCGHRLEFVDITRCPGVGVEAVEVVTLNARRLNHLMVEESKLSEAAKAYASQKGVRIS